MKTKTTVQIVLLAGFLLMNAGFAKQNEGKQRESDVVEWVKFKDAKTGNEVWQLTAHDAPSEAFYFYAQSFTRDDRYAIFSSKRSGIWDAYRCDLSTGVIVPLTSGEDLRRACMYPDGRSMAYISGWKYYTVDVHTLEREEIFDFTGKLPAPPFFRPSFTQDGRYTLVYTRDEATGSVLYRVDLVAKEILSLLEVQTGGFGHEQINPVNPDLIAYAPSPDTQNDMHLPMDKRPRARLINVDAGTNTPFLIAPYGFRATHDSWSPLGDRYFFFEKTQPGWTPVSIASIDLQGKDYTRHYTDDTVRLGHGAVSEDGAWFITDSQQSYSNPLMLINLKDGKSKTLCWPDASVNTPARVHVHPNFSTSGDYVIYTSDVVKTDTAQVYVVPIRHIKDAW